MNKNKKYDHERAFHLARFVECHFADYRIFEAADAFLTDKKRMIKGNYQSKCGAANQYKKILRMFFSEIRIEEITKKQILSKLEEHPEPWSIRLHFMWEFIFFLHDLGKLNEEWNQIVHLRERLCSNPSGNFSKTVLSVEDSSRYVLLKFGINTRLYYLDSGDAFLQSLMVEFLNKWDRLPDYKDCIFSFLFESCDIYITCIEDIDYSMFCKQISLLDENINRKKYLAQLIDFYRFIYANYNFNLFKETTEFDARFLLRQGLAADLAEGFCMVAYNPLEEYPQNDRWIINCYPFNEQYSRHMTLTHKIDLAKVKSERYRNYLKIYLWKHLSSWKSKFGTYQKIIFFLNYISDLKSGKELTIFTNKTTDENFRVEEMAAYRQHVISKYPNIKNQSHYLGEPAVFLKYLRDLKAVVLESGIFEYLKIKLANNTDKAPISDVDLNNISDIMRKHANASLKCALYYSVFYLALETEFRISQIINLEADCVQETFKTGQYIILSKTKNSRGEHKEQAITSFTKRHLDEIKRITESFRQSCPDETMKRLLFLEPYKEKENLFRPLNAEKFNKHLQQCCIEAGTLPYTFSNLRDTHMTKAEEFIIRRGLSDMYLSVLTDHKNPETTRKHYSQIELTEMLEAVHGIIIGNVHLEGTVLPELNTSKTETETVSNGCGYCQNPICTTKTYLSCLMCPHFVTIPERIPYFEEQLKILDYKIGVATILHDKEDLITIKRLFAAYLREMLLVKETAQYDSSN